MSTLKIWSLIVAWCVSLVGFAVAGVIAVMGFAETFGISAGFFYYSRGTGHPELLGTSIVFGLLAITSLLIFSWLTYEI